MEKKEVLYHIIDYRYNYYAIIIVEASQTGYLQVTYLSDHWTMRKDVPWNSELLTNNVRNIAFQ